MHLFHKKYWEPYMKKMYLVLFIVTAIFLGACSSSGSDDGTTTAEQTNNEEVKKPQPITEESLLGNMNLYYGNLHSHTRYSWGEVKDYTPADNFALAKEQGMDFCVVTDHDIWTKLNIFNDTWAKTGSDADALTTEGEFVAIRGFEWSNPTFGHICIFNTADFADFLSTPFNPILPELTPSIYNWIDKRNAIAQFNHPGREKKMFNNLEFNETVADNFCLMETGNKDDGNYTNDFIPNYILALDNGWKISPTSNQDNHVYYMNSHRTVIVAPELTRQSLFEAMSARRSYSTDDPDMRIIFKAGEDWMGSTVFTEDDSIVLTIMVKDNEPVSKIEIITNKGTVAAEKEFKKGETSALWQVTVPAETGTYYFAKITEEDSNNDEFDNRTFKDEDRTNGTQVAVTAPIWVAKY